MLVRRRHPRRLLRHADRRGRGGEAHRAGGARAAAAGAHGLGPRRRRRHRHLVLPAAAAGDPDDRLLRRPPASGSTTMRGCCRRKGYAYGEHVLPHDARVQELGSGKTRVETLTALGIRPRVLSAHRLEDGINAVRLLLPRCWFDAEKCARGLEALRHYRCEWDERRQAFRERPLHDWSSHAADAFRYLAMGLREETEERMPKIGYDDRGIV